jgi:hypothetical protein
LFASLIIIFDLHPRGLISDHSIPFRQIRAAEAEDPAAARSEGGVRARDNEPSGARDATAGGRVRADTAMGTGMKLKSQTEQLTQIMLQAQGHACKKKKQHNRGLEHYRDVT